MKLKRLLAFVLSAAALASCAGCGNGKVGNGEDPNKVPEDPYEIVWYTRASAQDDVETVEAKVNEYLKDKINATLKLKILDAAQYTKKMTTAVAAGEEFDLAFCGSGTIDYADSVRNGVLFDMADYVDDYMPDLKEQFKDAETFFGSAYVDGKLGGIPILKELGAEWGWIYRTDIAEKYGIDMSKMKTLEDLEPYLKKIKENEPGMEYPMEWDTTVSPQNTLSYMMPVTDCVVYLDEGKSTGKMQIFPDTDEFRNLAKVTRRFYQEGLVKKDVLTASDASARFKAGKAFCTIGSLKPGSCFERFPDMEYPIDQQAITVVTENFPTASMLLLSNSSKNPYRVMRFLNLLYSDPYLANLIVFGVEGVHYNVNSDGMVEQIEGSGYDMYQYQWMLGNIFLNKLRVGEDKDKHEKYKEFNSRVVHNDVVGFYSDNTEFELEKVAVGAVQKEYRKQAILGAMEPDAVIEEYVKKLKEAGIDKIIESWQKQYDEYLSKK